MKTNKHFSAFSSSSLRRSSGATDCVLCSRNRFWCLSVSEKRAAAAAEENDHKILKKNIFSLSLFPPSVRTFFRGLKIEGHLKAHLMYFKNAPNDYWRTAPVRFVLAREHL
jgi:hypothetical protein